MQNAALPMALGRALSDGYADVRAATLVRDGLDAILAHESMN